MHLYGANDVDLIFRYFHLGTNEDKPIKMQTGIVRTNCMDNLDRTNVVQAAIAKWTLNQQLRDLGILSETAGVDDYESFSKDFRESEGLSSTIVMHEAS